MCYNIEKPRVLGHTVQSIQPTVIMHNCILGPAFVIACSSMILEDHQTEAITDTVGLSIFLSLLISLYSLYIQSGYLLYIRWELSNRFSRKEQYLVLIRYRHLIRSRAVSNQFFFLRKDRFFLHACATCSELP